LALKCAMLLVTAKEWVELQQVVSFISWMITFGCFANGRPGSVSAWPLRAPGSLSGRRCLRSARGTGCCPWHSWSQEAGSRVDGFQCAPGGMTW
jgi:hypothetical protein